jgi:3-methylfumaryl-CoA hydratase
MFAAGQLELRSVVPVGAPLHRRSLVSHVEEKTGRSGRLVFVEVINEVSTAGVPAIVETQTIVYREHVAPSEEPYLAGDGLAPIEEDGWDWRIDLGTEATLLFRFSALTYNAHRIHYDRDYATGAEGYPGLVVHGPLQAVGLAELCRRHAGTRSVAGFTFRAVRPVFDGAPIRLRGRPIGDDRGELAAFDRHGQRTMIAEATFEPFL